MAMRMQQSVSELREFLRSHATATRQQIDEITDLYIGAVKFGSCPDENPVYDFDGELTNALRKIGLCRERKDLLIRHLQSSDLFLMEDHCSV